MENKEERFEYTYSAKEQEEIERIRQKYLPKVDDEREQLIKLDEKVTRKATMRSISIGIMGCLVFGIGLATILKGIKGLFGIGIAVGVLGLAVMGMVPSLHGKFLEKERQKYAPKILEITERLLHK